MPYPLVKLPRPKVALRAFPPASLHTGPTSVLFGLPSRVNSLATREPVPRGNRPVVRFAMEAASPLSRRASNCRAMTSSASPQVAFRKVESFEPLRPPVRISGWVRRRGLCASLRHHRRLHTDVAVLHGVVGATSYADDAVGPYVDGEGTVRVAELAGTGHRPVGLHRCRALGEVERLRPFGRGDGCAGVGRSVASADGAPTTKAALVSAAPWTNCRLLTGVLLLATSDSP